MKGAWENTSTPSSSMRGINAHRHINILIQCLGFHLDHWQSVHQSVQLTLELDWDFFFYFLIGWQSILFIDRDILCPFNYVSYGFRTSPNESTANED